MADDWGADRFSLPIGQLTTSHGAASHICSSGHSNSGNLSQWAANGGAKNAAAKE
jgi:hypothetical protein